MVTSYLPVMTQDKKEFRFWESDNSYFYYDRFLVSPFVSGMNITRKYFGEGKLNIFADSGGYQIVTQNRYVDPIEILQWQELTANVGFTVDIPPHHLDKKYTQAQFEKCKYQSNKNADLMWKLRVNDDMELWGVVQGKNYAECIEWYTDLTKDHAYDGYGVSLSILQNKSDISGWIDQLRFASTIPKRFHFLGFSDPLFMLVLAKFSCKTKINYTFDTSSSKQLAIYGKYSNPIDLTQISFSKKLSNKEIISSLPCICPVCKKHTVKDLMNTTQLLALHNLFTKIKFNELVNLIVDDDECFNFLLSKIIAMRSYYEKDKTNIVNLVNNLIFNENPNITNIKLDEFKGRVLKQVTCDGYLSWLLGEIK